MSVDSKKIHTTPKGISVYPKLIEPDTKFNKDGVYSVRVKFSKEDEDALIAELTALANEAYAAERKEKKKKTLKRAENPWKPEVEKVYDDEGTVIEENETGFMLFNFKLKAQVKSKTGKIIHMKPRLYDAKGVYIGNVEGLSIGGGSEIKVAFTVRPFMTDTIGFGISLQIQGVQVIKLVEFGAKSAESMGFGVEKDGFDGSSGGEAPGMPSARDVGPDSTDADF